MLNWLLIVTVIAATAHATTVTIDIPSVGSVEGVVTDGVAAFYGIPFAQPPTGNNRFRAPQPASPFTAVLDATAPAPVCPQLRLIGDLTAHKSWSEDCLTLDVYTPYPLPTDQRPVMAYIHGGGFVEGDDFNGGEFNGTHLAATYGVVVVSLNYRLDILGFLAAKALQEEDPNHSTGNQGIQDQRLALRWIQSHVAAFHGNASRVTLFGESAGAFSVCIHLSSPASSGLFSNIIMESGQCDSSWFYPPLDFAIGFGEGYTAELGCNATDVSSADYLSCLRSKPVLHLFDQVVDWFSKDGGWPIPNKPRLPVISPFAPVMAWGAAIDGSPEGLLDLPLNRIKAGTFNRVPVIAGTNQNEGTLFIPMFKVIADTPYPITQAGIEKALLHINSNQTVVDSILKQYALSAYPTAGDRFDAIIRDACLACPTRRLHRAVSSAGIPAFSYRYTFVAPTLSGDILKCFHSSELRYVFHTPHHNKAFNAQEEAVSATLEYYWGNAAWSSGDPNKVAPVPNHPSRPHWPAYTTATDQSMHLNETASPLAGLDKAGCDFWDSFPKSFC